MEPGQQVTATQSLPLIDDTTAPPSSVIVAPFTYAPARPDRKSAVPATSSGVPMRVSGMFWMISSPMVARVWAITARNERCQCIMMGEKLGVCAQNALLLWKGPHAMALLVIPSQPRRPARVLLSMCRPAYMRFSSPFHTSYTLEAMIRTNL